MSKPQPMLTDALLRDALSRRAAGPHSTGELLDDVLLVVESTRQSRGWAIQLPRLSRPLAVLVVGALLVSALVGSAIIAGARLATPTIPLGDGDIAFVQARYAWDGSKDGYGGPTPTVEGQGIFRVSSAGGEPTFVAEVPAADRQTLVGSPVGPSVRWSPDGSRMAFRLLLDAPGIYVMNRDGTGLTRLTNLPEPAWQRDWGQPTRGGFAWSPDGTRIAFTSPVGTDGPGGSRSSSLYAVDTSDGRLTELTGPTATGGAFPPIAWSPDGSQIAFARSSGPLRRSTNSLVVMDADGTDEVLVVQVGTDLGPLAWSPDGSRIAFMRSSEMDGNVDRAGGMWVVNPDGSDLQQIAIVSWAGPSELRTVIDGPFEWSSDGSWIATLGGPRGGGEIRLVAADGSEERVISEPGPGKENWINHFAWSPDGSQLVFSGDGEAIGESPPTWDPPSIYVVNADGTDLRWLADGEYPDW